MAAQRYQASSRIVLSVDQIGFIYLDRDQEEEGVCKKHEKTFEPCTCHGMSVQLAKMPTSQITTDSCFAFQEDRICVPPSVFDEEKVNCTTFVASFISFENGTGHILLSSYPLNKNLIRHRPIPSLLCFWLKQVSHHWTLRQQWDED